MRLSISFAFTNHRSLVGSFSQSRSLGRLRPSQPRLPSQRRPWPRDIRGSDFGARNFSCFFLLNEERFRTPESSTSQDSFKKNGTTKNRADFFSASPGGGKIWEEGEEGKACGLIDAFAEMVRFFQWFFMSKSPATDGFCRGFCHLRKNKFSALMGSDDEEEDEDWMDWMLGYAVCIVYTVTCLLSCESKGTPWMPPKEMRAYSGVIHLHRSLNNHGSMTISWWDWGCPRPWRWCRTGCRHSSGYKHVSCGATLGLGQSKGHCWWVFGVFRCELWHPSIIWKWIIHAILR